MLQCKTRRTLFTKGVNDMGWANDDGLALLLLPGVGGGGDGPVASGALDSGSVILTCLNWENDEVGGEGRKKDASSVHGMLGDPGCSRIVPVPRPARMLLVLQKRRRCLSA